MICGVHGIDEMECPCPQWSDAAKREFVDEHVRGTVIEAALISKALTRGIKMKLKAYPMVSEPQKELENIHALLKEKRYIEAEDRLARVMNWRLLER